VGERGEIDFVEDLAIHVPLIVICELMGLDPDTRLRMYRWSDAMMAGDGATTPDDPRLITAAEAFGEYAEVCTRLINERRDEPQDDLISILTRAYDEGELEKEFMSSQGVNEEDFSGEPMPENELLLFLTIALVAGNETTRNAISGGMRALSQFPEEKQRLLDNLDDDEFVDLAVDELIRYVSPVMSFMRTVTEDHTYKGVDFKEGDRVLMLYQSANRDERHFDDPDRLILDRDPNTHIAFGYGVHFCLGANLARMEVKVVFQELFRRLCDIRVADGAEIERNASSLVLAISRLPVVFTPESECPVQH
jgi:cytochrome P450 family 142 subfamily A polypeptide 1